MRSQISDWKFNKHNDRSKMTRQIVINNFVVMTFLSAMRYMESIDALTMATPSVDGMVVVEPGVS